MSNVKLPQLFESLSQSGTQSDNGYLESINQTLKEHAQDQGWLAKTSIINNAKAGILATYSYIFRDYMIDSNLIAAFDTAVAAIVDDYNSKLPQANHGLKITTPIYRSGGSR